MRRTIRIPIPFSRGSKPCFHISTVVVDRKPRRQIVRWRKIRCQIVRWRKNCQIVRCQKNCQIVRCQKNRCQIVRWRKILFRPYVFAFWFSSLLSQGSSASRKKSRSCLAPSSCRRCRSCPVRLDSRPRSPLRSSRCPWVQTIPLEGPAEDRDPPPPSESSMCATKCGDGSVVVCRGKIL